jgi:hypothetical protein
MAENQQQLMFVPEDPLVIFIKQLTYYMKLLLESKDSPEIHGYILEQVKWTRKIIEDILKMEEESTDEDDDTYIV